MSTEYLFGALPAFLPSWARGETLFSWSARYHRLVGGGPAQRSSQQLFGCSKAGLKHDFPFHLDRFAAITGGLMGSAESIALERTLLQYYAPFLTPDDVSRATGLMRGPSVTTLKNLLGILPSRVGAAHPLKACDECIKADREEHGVSLWHLEHQWPSSWICRAHGDWLMQVRSGVSVVGYEKWLLPEDIPRSAWVKTPIVDGAGGAQTLAKIADASAGFVATRNAAFDCRILRHTYLIAAKTRGWLAPDGSLRLPLIREAFLRDFQAILQVPCFAFLNTVRDVNGGVIGLLMRQHPGRRHPLKHALAVTFLFDSFKDFLAAYNRDELVARDVGPENVQLLLATEYRVRLRRLVEDGHKSVSAAARAIDVCEGVANRWARKDHFVYKARPRVLDAEREEKLRRLLAEGKDYAAIGSELSMRKSFVRSYVAKDAVLRRRWRQTRIDMERDRHRNCFLSIAETHPGWTLKAMRRLPGNGVSWLMRNDREWLREHLPDLGIFRKADCESDSTVP